MRRWIVLLAVGVLTMTVLAAPAAAGPKAENTQIGGTGVVLWSESLGFPYEGGDCAPLPELGAFGDYTDLTMRIEGDLEGCWYTKVDDSRSTPSGAYKEYGREVFVADGSGDMFTTTYSFTGKFDAEAEIHGRCQHVIVAGSGTGDFVGATGRIDFKDDVDAGINYYRGHIKTPTS